ncbi:esterase-like activity of phytase family protein [Actinoplanes sp. DH11]|uniref:esterase-like activity of phytase family protein n=1 Tax=Actinoplanes sp. DH11 TaxID=2857011 RepID=UPI001E338BC7|nr:esterase-like activity of phytase family protein [Actinoplanes sp. DH11]
MSLRRTTSAVVSVAAVAVAAAGTVPTAAAAHGYANSFERLATFPAYLNSSIDDTAAAEISTVTEDGRTVVYTDSPGKRLGFVDITDPSRPKPAGTLAMDGEPTSVAHLGRLLLAGVNTRASFTSPSGKLVVIDAATRTVVRSLELGGQPDSVAVAPSGRYIAVAIENERDEDVNDGAIPQAPAGWLSVIDTRTWQVTKVSLDGLADVAPTDPEPEYVSINSRDEAVVSLQENNHLAVVSLRTGRVISDFSAGTVTVNGVDVRDDDQITLDGSITAKREPDGVAWITEDLFATANEGDYEGGSRGWSIFDKKTGKAVWDAGNTLEHLAVEHGQYPDKRSDAKGIEVENVAFGRLGGVPYVFVNSERGNFTAAYDVSKPAKPRFKQLMPTTNAPEGVVTVPSRGLVVVSSEEEDASIGIRGSIQIFKLGARAEDTQISSKNTIPWGALSGLSPVPGSGDKMVAVTDSVYTPTRILTLSTDGVISKQLTVTKDNKPVGYDAEGLVAREKGGYWLAVEGSASTPNLLVRLDSRGRVQEEITLPADVAATITTNGLEGVAENGRHVWVAVQRTLKGDPANTARIGRYDTVSKTWSWLLYPLDTAPTGWVGLSELVAVDGNTFAVVERDNQRGPLAAVKKVYTFDVPTGSGSSASASASVSVSVSASASAASWVGTPVVTKKLRKDLLPLLKAGNGWVQDKVEGLAIAGDGRTYAVTDNDGLDDSTGETVLLNLGRLL